jgi:nicotinate phosphoribosyltransferase
VIAASAPSRLYDSNMASALATDLYQLTMMAGYLARGQESATATFELFVRRLPAHRAFLVVAGVAPFLDFLEKLRFDEQDIRRLRDEPALSTAPSSFFDWLRRFRFTGDVFAMIEGTPAFANEPLLRVTAPIAEAQLVETAALAFGTFQTAIASKAARVVHAANGRPVMEFGARRAHGLEAALFASRAAHLAGCTSTSFVEAGVRFGIPLSGTMAHSWVLSSQNELSAFTSYNDLFGGQSVLLLDTYDTIAAAHTVVRAGLKPAGVRLDSGDLLSLSREVRQILDAGGLRQTQIIASGDLDEFSVQQLLTGGAPIDAFGVGTSIVTSVDAPALGGVYKLVELLEQGQVRRVMKTSPGKATWPGRKQVWRVVRGGVASADVVAFEEERPPSTARPLLQMVMRSGQRLSTESSLAQLRDQCRARIAELPGPLHRIDVTATYPVEPSDRLRNAIEGRIQD